MNPICFVSYLINIQIMVKSFVVLETAFISEQELRQAGHYTPMASNKMQYINWLLYNSVLQI